MTIANKPHGDQMRAPIPARGWRATFSSLENRNYRWFWFSMLASFSGMQMQMLARGWLVYDLTKSTLDLGWVTFGFGLPILLFSAIGGVFADRVEKRNLLIITQILNGAVNLVVAILISTGAIEVWHIMVTSVLTGMIFAFNMPGRQSIVPGLVERGQIMNAVALSSGAMNLTRIAVPALAGVLMSVIGIDWVFYLTVVCSLVAAAFMSVIPPLGIADRDADSTAKSDLLQGFSYARRSPVLVALLTLAFVPIVFGMTYQTLMPAFAVEVLNLGPSGLGLLMAMVGIGALMGSLTAASMGGFKQKGTLLLGASATFGVFLILFSAASSLYLALFILLWVGAANMIYSATNNTLLQLNIDDRMRGRVMGIYMINIGLQPLAALPMGAIAQVSGVQWVVGGGCAVVVMFTLAMAFLRPGLRRL